MGIALIFVPLQVIFSLEMLLKKQLFAFCKDVIASCIFSRVGESDRKTIPVLQGSSQRMYGFPKNEGDRASVLLDDSPAWREVACLSCAQDQLCSCAIGSE